MLFFNRRQKLAQLRLVSKLGRTNDLGCALHVNLTSLTLSEHRWVPQCEGVPDNSFILFAVRGELRKQVASNGFKRPTGIVAIQKVRGRVQLGLGKRTVRPDNFVARIAAR